MRVEHPIASQDEGVVDDHVDVDGDLVPVDEDGTFEVSDRGWAAAFAQRYDTTLEDVLVDDAPAEDDGGESDDADVCGAELSDGGTCERPAVECPYHGEED